MKQTLEKQLESAFKFMVKHPLKNPGFIEDLYQLSVVSAVMVGMNHFTIYVMRLMKSI